MTEEGREKQQLVEATFSRIEQQALMDISDEEFDAFMAVYQKIYRNLLDKCEGDCQEQNTEE